MLTVDKLAEDIRGLELHEQVDHVVQSSGLIEHYKKEKGERGEGRVENLLELVSAARGFSPEGETDMQPLESFLAHAVLESGEGQADPYTDCVQMMTLHSAKGLEFPVVFLAGMEDGLFPHQRSAADLAALEEERRLCYVGATRAMRQLYITYAEQRRLYGVDQYGQPSRFIHELPPELIEEIRPRLQVSRPAFAKRDYLEEAPSSGNAARQPGTAREIRRRRGAQFRGQRAAGPHPGELRAAGHQVADALLRQSRGRLRRSRCDCGTGAARASAKLAPL